VKKAPRIVFQTKRITETDWLIEASIPGSDIRIIDGLTSKGDADDWMNGERKVSWLRSKVMRNEIDPTRAGWSAKELTVKITNAVRTCAQKP
jgi:hypothetical protein